MGWTEEGGGTIAFSKLTAPYLQIAAELAGLSCAPGSAQNDGPLALRSDLHELSNAGDGWLLGFSPNPIAGRGVQARRHRCTYHRISHSG